VKCSKVLQCSDVLFFYRFLYCCMFCILIFVFLFLSLCILFDIFALFCVFFANWHSPAILTEVSPCSFLSCNANARVYFAKTGHGPHTSYLVYFVVPYIVVSIVLFYVLFVCECVPYYCHRVSTQLQLNIPHYIK